MSKILVDPDSEAMNMRRQLDSAIAVIIASGVKQNDFILNFSGGLTDAVSVKANAEMILRHVESHDLANVDRFRALHKEAEKAILKFWRNFTLATIDQSAAQISVTGHVAETPKGTYVVKNGTPLHRQTKPTKTVRTPMLSAETVAKIRKDIREGYGGKLSHSDLTDLAEMYGTSHSTIYRIYSRTGAYK